ncbi:MAG: SDR family oxidoreductase [Lachnospiraceae bacterium]|nr:SDR family oxidoreductase [Lachnospiraceae bacterium]
MKVLLLGSKGMLGQAIHDHFSEKGIEVITAARHDADYCFDFTDDEELKKCLFSVKPEIVINTAAIVDLGFCEEDAGTAYRVNARLPGILAELCREFNSYFIHISTDHYYISGGKTKHNEQERVFLVNEYARTKYIGEVLSLMYDNTLVLRTNIVGFRGTGKATFVEWAVKELEKGSRLNLFTDFYTSSIHTVDFARILLDLIRQHPVGILNLASSDVSSKKDFIISLSKALYNKEPDYVETSVKEISGPKRASSLGLDTGKAGSIVGYSMPGLDETIHSIVDEYHKRRNGNEL